MKLFIKRIVFISFFVTCNSIVHAQSLIQMQRDYDAMKEKIASTMVELPCLEADRKRASYIKSILYEKLIALDSSLTVTKNYKQADQKYNELMRLFQDDPEANAIRINFSDFKEADTFRMNLVKNNSISLIEYETWKKNILNKYKSLNGANFQGRSGIYNSISDIILN